MTTVVTEPELFLRGTETALASWEAYAHGSPGAAVIRSPGAAAAVFPNDPERGVYNNAILERELSASERTDAVDSMEAAYADAGVTRFAAWVHESDEATCMELERRGYTLDTSTRAMGMELQPGARRPAIELTSIDWDEYLCSFGLPRGLLSRADRSPFHVLVARLDGETAATAMAFDHEGDCGIYNVATLAHARRRGLGTALTVIHVHDAFARGCRTASLQSTEMAEQVYAAAGFRDLGRILEYVPAEA